MTLDDLKCQNCSFYGFFGDFRLRGTFQEQIALNSPQTDQDKLHMKFSALNVHFNSPSLDLLGSWKLAHEGIREGFSHKNLLFYHCWLV